MLSEGLGETAIIYPRSVTKAKRFPARRRGHGRKEAKRAKRMETMAKGRRLLPKYRNPSAG
jgi:hypothetical protein